MSEDIWKALVGFLVIVIGVLAQQLVRAKRTNGESVETVKARDAAVQRIVDHVDAARKDILQEIKDTRHALRNEMTTFGGEISQEVKEQIAHFARRR